MKETFILDQNVDKIINQIKRELRNNIDVEYRDSYYRFFKEKEKIKKIGVRGSVVKKVIRKYFNLLKKEWKYKDFVKLSEKLLKDGWSEERGIAFGIMQRLKKQFTEETFYLFEKWLNKHVDNWASCDGLSTDLIGEVIDKYPKFINNLIKWTKSKNRWIRRSSAVSLIIHAREGKHLKEIFKISKNLMLDKDDMIQKGYGWLLKEASKKHQKEVFEFVMKYKNKIPRTALRYAIEKMPQNLRKEAMKK